MTSSRQAAARAALGRPELRRLWATARRRLEEGGPARSFTIADLSDDEAVALAQVLGSAKQARGRARVSIDALDEALQGSRLAIGLRETLEILSGPLADRRAERRAHDLAKAGMWQAMAEHAAVARHPALAGWLDDLQRNGGLLRTATSGGAEPKELVQRALDVLARLPAGGVSLSVLAAEVTGDAHALDSDRPLGGLVLRAVARLAGESDAPTSASGRRQLWAELGVLCDPLSAHVLALGLRVLGESLVARQLAECAAAGEPRRVTLRELQREQLRVPAGTEVFVCENPSVVAAAADRLGAGTAGLVCTEGMPSSAVMKLLIGLGRAGACVHIHADFDWGGIRIANFLASKVPFAQAWRLSRVDYERALADCRETAPLVGGPVEASWDGDLARAVARAGRAVLEEHVLADLLADLSAVGPHGC